MAIGRKSPAMLDAMPAKERATSLRELWSKMDAWAAVHVAAFHWHRAGGRPDEPPYMNNGSCCFLDFSGNLFLVTAAHVYREYQEGKKLSGETNIICKIDNIRFDPEANLRDCNDRLDIATFRFSYDDLIQMHKQAVSGSPWPPPDKIPEGLVVWFSGFLGINRLFVETARVNFGVSVGHLPITTVSDHQITCRFDRELFDNEHCRIAQAGIDLGGISGGPLLLPFGNKDGEWSFGLGGIVNEAHSTLEWEKVVAVRAHYINLDGSISRI